MLLQPGPNGRATSDWTRDDRWLVHTETDPKTGADIWLLGDPSKPVAERKPVAWLRTPAMESQGQISPDGRWLAYWSDESGRFQIYLRPFTGAAPTTETKWAVSAVSGREPRWRGDGKELFWIEVIPGTTRTRLMAAGVGQAPNRWANRRPCLSFKRSSSFRRETSSLTRRLTMVNGSLSMRSPRRPVRRST
jgi:Tol biopolymer transport system component